MQTDSVAAIAYISVKALFAIGLWGAAAVGHLRGPLLTRRSGCWPRPAPGCWWWRCRSPTSSASARRRCSCLALVAHARRDGGVSALCLAAVLSVAAVRVPTERFTLASDAPVEKVRWEEDYALRPEGLVLVEARVRGNGAGMEIPEGAQLRDGAPALPPPGSRHSARLRLARPAFAGDYEICCGTATRTPLAMLGAAVQASDTVELYRCP
ncbi:MAG: DUF1850 domain-containing protein [Chromatiales bacterium]|nr:DUF1850 domain-containing protein [Chromatiales bacterium]